MTKPQVMVKNICEKFNYIEIKYIWLYKSEDNSIHIETHEQNRHLMLRKWANILNRSILKVETYMPINLKTHLTLSSYSGTTK